MTTGLLGGPLPEQPTFTAFAVNKLTDRALPQGLVHLRRIARHDTDTADIRAALKARDTVSPVPDGTMSLERMEARQADHDAALAARATARATVDRLSRLPPVHADALIRLSTPSNLGPISLAYWKTRLDRMDAHDKAHPNHIKIFERHEGIAAAEAMLTWLSPPGGEATSRGTWHVRGDEDGIRRASEQAAEHWHELYTDNPGMDERREPWIAREHMDPRWHRRRIRREALRAGAYWDMALRLARPTSPYVSGYTHEGWRQRRDGAQVWAAEQVVCFDDGSEPVPLATVQANAKKSARARMYALVKAMEHAGHVHDYTAFFVTLTLPGAWHPAPSGKRSPDGKYPQCADNAEWTPRHGPAAQHAEIQAREARLRARIGKHHELRNYFGIFVPEPHLDGTEHCHAMLWMPSCMEDGTATEGTLRAILDDIAPGREGKTEVIRKVGTGTASPASYVMKYVLKSLDGDDQADTDAPDGEDHLAGEKHERYRAWASARGLRRMRLVGVHGGLRVWQRLWTAKADEPLPPRGTLARAAIQRGRAAGVVATDTQLTDTERSDARTRQNAAFAEALGIVGALRCMSADKGRLRLEYEDTVSEHGRPTRRAVGIKGQVWDADLLTHVDDGERFPLRVRVATLMCKDDLDGKVAESGGVTVVANGPRSEAGRDTRPLDEDEIRYVINLEALVSERRGIPEWEAWCAARRERLARLRKPPPDRLAA